MNEHAKQWVSALRSGEFEQGQDALRTGDHYCCLGVACELYRRETGASQWLLTSDGNYMFEGGMSILPTSVRDWLGLTDAAGLTPGESSLATRNDGGDTFEQIADIIEAEPAGLFS